ncbi:hypothetical protein LINPERPRIM_LOCUS26063 [Linum perenne]
MVRKWNGRLWKETIVHREPKWSSTMQTRAKRRNMPNKWRCQRKRTLS